MSPRHSDARPGWIIREFAKIRKQMREDRAARRLESATIGKGGVTVKNDGSVGVIYPNGNWAGRFGVFGEGADKNYGLYVLDDDGASFLAAVFIPDTSESVVFCTADSAVFGGGAFTVSTPTGQAVWANGTSGVWLDGSSLGVKIAHSTTGAAANCFIDPSDSRIWRSTSSRRYKQDIEDTEVDPVAVLEMQGRTWRDKGEVEREPGTERRYVGFIAEELHDLGLGQFVVYDDEGEPEAIAYDRLSVALLAVLKDQDRRLKALEAHEAPADT